MPSGSRTRRRRARTQPLRAVEYVHRRSDMVPCLQLGVAEILGVHSIIEDTIHSSSIKSMNTSSTSSIKFLNGSSTAQASNNRLHHLQLKDQTTKYIIYSLSINSTLEKRVLGQTRSKRRPCGCHARPIITSDLLTHGAHEQTDIDPV